MDEKKGYMREAYTFRKSEFKYDFNLSSLNHFFQFAGLIPAGPLNSCFFLSLSKLVSTYGISKLFNVGYHYTVHKNWNCTSLLALW